MDRNKYDNGIENNTRHPEIDLPLSLRRTKKAAFSLAEAMIMLVIVAILMAVSAPLITKKAANDAKRLILQGAPTKVRYINTKSEDKETSETFASVVSAMGRLQNFGIGTNKPNAKLHIKTTANEEDLLNVGNVTNNAANDTGLYVNNSGQVNIVACVPDWKNATYFNNESVWGTDSHTYTAPDDGYIAIANVCIEIKENTGYDASLENIKFCPPVLSVNTTDNKCCDYKFSGLYNLIPIEKGHVVKRLTPSDFANTEPFYNITVEKEFTGKKTMYIPCKKGYKGYTRN